jgi:hypothetical protein
MKISKLTDAEFQAALNNFASKIGNYAATLGITPAEVASIQADNNFFTFVANGSNQIKQHGKDWTSYKNILRSSTKAVNLGDAPAWIAPPAVPAVAADISGRWGRMIQRIKSNENYTEAIGNDLGITAITSSLTPADLAVLKPILTVHLVAGQPTIEWQKGDADGIAIYSADGNTGVYNFLATDLHPNFPDKRPLPAAGQSLVRKYKAIYILGDEQVGQWSDEVSISVMG